MRTPKVYNALITTDQNLIPSRAYPLIQSTIHEAPFYYPYGFNGFPTYGYYDPYNFSPFSPPLSGETRFVAAKYNSEAAIAATKQSESASAATAAATATAVASVSTDGDKAVVSNANSARSTEKSPIPLNELGFPPSLIPISPNQINPYNLAPFPYNSYPLIYDQFSGFQQPNYLPHFGLLPQGSIPAFSGPPGTAATAESFAEQNAAVDIKTDSGNAPANAHTGNEIGANGNQVFFDRENGVSERPTAAAAAGN